MKQYVYVMNDAAQNRCKVGFTSWPGFRRKEISAQLERQVTLDYLHECGELGRKVERRAHQILRARRIGRREWFTVPKAKAIKAVKQAHTDVTTAPDMKMIERCKDYLLCYGWTLTPPRDWPTK